MKVRRSSFSMHLFAIVIALGTFAGASYAQVSISLSRPCSSPSTITSPASDTAPSGCFKVTATATGSPSTVVFYKNDVPYETFTGAGPHVITQQNLGQDTFTYKARAYYSATSWTDSSDVVMTVQTPLVFKMGDVIPTTSMQTYPGIRNHDHTIEIREAIKYLTTSPNNGGTLFFPCYIPDDGNPSTPPQLQAYYSIRDTVDIPGNITLQSEGSEVVGNCRIYWHDSSWFPTPPAPPEPDCHDNTGTSYPLTGKPMFRVQAGAERVRFRDMWMYSRSSGDGCYPRYDYDRIAAEETVAIELNSEYVPPCETFLCSDPKSKAIRDVVLENISITSFTHGIKAVALDGKGDPTDSEISNVRIRGYRPQENFRQMTVNAKFAYDWDIQNFNITGMAEDQGGVDIINAGYPEEYSRPLPGFKFSHLNCNGNGDRAHPPAFCLQVEKHGGLFFRQLHHEGVPTALTVRDISGRASDNVNNDPIVMEGSVASGSFEDPSMQLFLIGNSISTPEEPTFGLDDGKMRFSGNGVNATIVDCGDFHYDWTDGRGPGQTTKPEYSDLKMLWSHAERNRSSFFAKDSSSEEYLMPHTYCPANIGEVGGLYFDNGVLPTGGAMTSPTIQYSQVFNPSCGLGSPAACLQDLMGKGGVVYIPKPTSPATSYSIGAKIDVPKGSIVVGETDAAGTPLTELSLTAGQNYTLFQIDVPITAPNTTRVSGTVIRNLKLSSTSRIGTNGISINGLACYPISPRTDCDPGASSDIHLSGISFKDFATGLYAGRGGGSNAAHPMIDGVSVKTVSFTDNNTAVRIDSSNLSNWNVMDVKMEANLSTAYGWDQTYGGHVALQDVSCKGTSSNPLKECIRMQMSGDYITGLRKPEYVENALTIGLNGNVQSGEYSAPLPNTLLIRNSDLSSANTNDSYVNVIGKAHITSINNKYRNFRSFGTTYGGDISRLTWCDDDYPGGTAYPGLNTLMDHNYWVGVPTETRIHCGSRPMPFDDAVRWGDAYDTGTSLSTDVPLVGNFYDNVKDDFVFYRDGATTGAQSYFHIKKYGTPNDHMTVAWGIKGDIPVTGNFLGSTSLIAVFRPSTGVWWIKDPNSSTAWAFAFGLAGDTPFVGNFFDETGSADKDEIGMARLGSGGGWEFYVINPITGETRSYTESVDYGSQIEVGDFLGLGHDQVAQFQAGTWHFRQLDTGYTSNTATLGTTGDQAVAGKYLGPSGGGAPQCSQIGVWNPTSQKLKIADANSTCGTRGTGTAIEMLWGSNNDYYGATSYADDVQFAMTGGSGLARPTVYRPTRGIFNLGIANGQWFVHDEFP